MALDLDRRSLLAHGRTVGAASALVTLGGACTQDVPPRPPGVETLGDELAHTMQSLIEVVLPAHGSFPGGTELGILQDIDAALAAESEVLRSMFTDALLFLEWAPQFSLRFKPFSALPPADRAAVFAGFGTSWLGFKRTIYTALKGMIVFAYADRPEVWSHVGYDGPWVGRG